jgi:excisionase family DNA binding protein
VADDSTPPSPPIAVRVKEGARLIGVSRAHLNKLLRAKKIPSRKDGTARLILTEDLIAYVKGLPGAEPEDEPVGPLLPIDEQKVARKRARRAGKPIPPPVPPPPPPRPPDIDLAAIYDGRRRLLVPDVGPTEARRRAYEFTVQACARHFSVSLDEAGEMVLAACAEHGWLEPNPSAKGLLASTA